MVTETIGAYLRRLGVAGLVFPSARSDNFARYNEGRLTDHGGWNFLDLRGASTRANSAEFFREVFDISIMDFLYSTNFEEAGKARGGWSRESVARGHQVHNAEAFSRVHSESEEQRASRKEDYRLYWKTIELLELPHLTEDLTECMAHCGLDGSVEDIPVRMWQYVLYEALLHEGRVPRSRGGAWNFSTDPKGVVHGQFAYEPGLGRRESSG